VTGEPVIVQPDAPAQTIHDAVTAARERGYILVIAPKTVGPAPIDVLMRAVARPNVATASPIPVAQASSATVYVRHSASPPDPTLPLPCRELCAISGSALASLPMPPAPTLGSGTDYLTGLSEALGSHGWRHVGAPGVALAWDAADSSGIRPVGAWTERAVAARVGPSNVALEAHRNWAAGQLLGTDLVIDGACLGPEAFTGTQVLVLAMARWMAAARPECRVRLATSGRGRGVAARALADTSVEIVERGGGVRADVLFRPYQMIFGHELPFVERTGTRLVVGQLDMIGFDNAGYHPAPELLFFARNLQRHLMRRADGVLFISNFSLESAVAECPDLDPRRLHVVPCGADTEPREGFLAPARAPLHGRSFIACLASTFWHKNRAHAIRTFEHLVTESGYDGDLVLGGPEPYYGRSVEAEGELIGRMPPAISDRIHHLGHVTEDEKWWILARAGLVLYPSVVEGFGLVPFEAASVGTPCLAFEGTAPGEYLAGTGALVSGWDVRVWARRSAELLASAESSERLVTAVRAAAAGLTWRRSAELAWQAVDSVMAQPCEATYADDGAPWATVSSRAKRGLRSARPRFAALRTVSAVRRRLRHYTRPKGAPT
jgi:glycosyltransferase involved in cell wall biosynthesis